jgi:hypothetical protein
MACAHRTLERARGCGGAAGHTTWHDCLGDPGDRPARGVFGDDPWFMSHPPDNVLSLGVR